MFSTKEKAVVKYIFIVIFLMATLVCIIAVAKNNAQPFDKNNYYTKSYCVIKGDTLWEIGEQYKLEEDDVRDWIKAVKEINGMSSSSVKVNDYITILIPKN